MGGRAGTRWGRSCRTLWARGRTRAFTLRRWEPAGLGAEEARGLTQVSPGTPWRLRRGGQSVCDPDLRHWPGAPEEATEMGDVGGWTRWNQSDHSLG